MNKDELHSLLHDPNNWQWGGGSYSCSEDPRVIVPQRIWWCGYSVNFAHKNAVPALIGIVLPFLLPFLSFFAFNMVTAIWVTAILIFISTIVTTYFCHWESTRER